MMAMAVCASTSIAPVGERVYMGVAVVTVHISEKK